jgi:hypothetical protein
VILKLNESSPAWQLILLASGGFPLAFSVAEQAGPHNVAVQVDPLQYRFYNSKIVHNEFI